MTFDQAVEQFIGDMRSQGRINSDRTEESYRARLAVLRDEVGNRDPRKVGRTDIKRTLARWPHPNTQATARAIYVSFFDWTMEEGYRETNPGRMVRRPKKRPSAVYRLTRAEVVALMAASNETRRARWVIHVGVCAGLRNQELRGVQRRHFERPGYVWVSHDIAKGKRERWVPVIAELEPVVAEILEHLDGHDDHVFASRRCMDPPRNTRYVELRDRGGSPRAIHELVDAVGKAAGIGAHVHPHLLRHAFGDHIARYAGLKVAQAVLGHVDVSTTETSYTGGVTLDELTVAMGAFTYGGYSPANPPAIPVEATTGIEPVVVASGSTTRGRPRGAPDAAAADDPAGR